MLAHLTRIFSTKAGSAGSGAKINERDPGKTCLRLKVGKLLPKPHGPKGAELGGALAEAGEPNARPGTPSAGGSEGRRVPQRSGGGGGL